MKPAHRRPELIALVAVGGTVGTALRLALQHALAASPFPWVTLTINVTGAFLLGALLQAIPLLRWGHAIRLTLGTGLLGGYTTYSAFALEVLALPGILGAAFAVGSVIAGALSAWLGFRLARPISPARTVS